MKFRRKETIVDYTKEEYTKCWTCSNACGGCSWSREAKPVKGWRAEKTFLPANLDCAESYMVYDCPLYKKG